MFDKNKESDKLNKAIKTVMLESKNVKCEVLKSTSKRLLEINNNPLLAKIVDFSIVKEKDKTDIIVIKPIVKLALYQKLLIEEVF